MGGCSPGTDRVNAELSLFIVKTVLTVSFLFILSCSRTYLIEIIIPTSMDY